VGGEEMDKSIKISEQYKDEIEQYSENSGISQKRIIEDGWKLYKKDKGISYESRIKEAKNGSV
jgi:hypothetical protein